MSDDKLTVNGLAEGLALVIEAIRESNQGQRDRLLIMDSQMRILDEFTDRLEAVESRFEKVFNELRAMCRICARLNILCTDVGTKDKGPQPNESDDEDIEQKLTHWN